MHVRGPCARVQVPPKVTVHALQNQVHVRGVDCRDDVFELDDVRMPQLLEGAYFPDGGVWETWGCSHQAGPIVLWTQVTSEIAQHPPKGQEDLCFGRGFMFFPRVLAQCPHVRRSSSDFACRNLAISRPELRLEPTLDEVKTSKTVFLAAGESAPHCCDSLQ